MFALTIQARRQAVVGRVVATGNLDGVMVSTLAQNARNMGSIPVLDAIFPIFIIHKTVIAMTMILYRIHSVWLLNLSCVCICKVISHII